MSPDLQQRLRKALINNPHFETDSNLRTLFGSDSRLQQWQHSLPGASSPMMRVNYVIADLLNNWNTDQDNALYLLLHVLYESQGDNEIKELAELVRKATLDDQIAEWKHEVARLESNYGKSWDDPEYNRKRCGELQATIQEAKKRKNIEPNYNYIAPEPTTTSHVSDSKNTIPPTELYPGLEIHIESQGENDTYYVRAKLDGGRNYSGEFTLDDQFLQDLQEKTDPKNYGLALFDKLFVGDIRLAYMEAATSAKLHKGRLRLQLWIDQRVAELHALAWERLYERRENGAFRVATNPKRPFSRYLGLQRSETPPLQGQIRMLCVFANPKNTNLAQLDIDAEIDNLRTALNGLKQSGVQITFMTGSEGITDKSLREKLLTEGYIITEEATTFDNIYQKLTYDNSYHILHIVGHGEFRTRNGLGYIYLEDDDPVEDDEFTQSIADLEVKPHLIFLNVCDSANRTANDDKPFVGLGPQLVQAGVPAVIAMREKIGLESAQRLSQHFYRLLLEHGTIDKALNRARSFLRNKNEWDIPILFMHLKDGQLFTPESLPKSKKN